jgi:hypothetical protein
MLPVVSWESFLRCCCVLFDEPKEELPPDGFDLLQIKKIISYQKEKM